MVSIVSSGRFLASSRSTSTSSSTFNSRARSIFFSFCIKHLVECFGLWERAGESIEQAATVTGWIPEGVCHHGHDQLVGDKFPTVHVFLGLDPQFCFILDCRSEHVTGREMRDRQVLAKLAGLGSFPGSWRTDKNNKHDELSLPRLSTEDYSSSPL